MNLRIAIGLVLVGVAVYAFIQEWGYLFWGLLIFSSTYSWYFLGDKEEYAKAPLPPQKTKTKFRLIKKGLEELPALPEDHYIVFINSHIFDRRVFRSVPLKELSKHFFRGNPDKAFEDLIEKWEWKVEHKFMVAYPTGWCLDIITTGNPKTPGGEVLRVIRLEDNRWVTFNWEGGKEDGHGDFMFTVESLMKKPKLWAEYLEKQKKFNQPE